MLPSSAPGHSWLAAAALSAAQAGGTGQGTARGWRSGTRRRSRWVLAKSGGTGCALELWRLPILRAWPVTSQDPPDLRRPSENRERKEKRRRQLNELLH